MTVSTVSCYTPVKPVEKPLGEEAASRGTRSPDTLCPAPLFGPVQPLWQKTSQESPTCLNTCWWYMNLSVPPKYCQTVDSMQEDLPGKVQLQEAHEERRSSAGNWTCRQQGPVYGGMLLLNGSSDGDEDTFPARTVT